MLKTFFNHKTFIFTAIIFAAVVVIAHRFGQSALKKVPDVIVQSEAISDINNFIKPDEYNQSTFVIFDIDNTLARSPGHYGSDQWFTLMIKKYKKQGLSTQEATQAIFPELFQITTHSWLMPVEKNTTQVVKDLQKRGVTVIALTSRSLDMTYRTIVQLKHIGIEFDGKGPKECPVKYGDGKPALYINGIMFSGNHSKGEVIAHWLDQINYHPKKIIFIDDKMKNIASVEQALHKRNYPFIGIRYGYLDDYIKEITPEIIAEEQAAFAVDYPESKPITPMPAHP